MFYTPTFLTPISCSDKYIVHNILFKLATGSNPLFQGMCHAVSGTHAHRVWCVWCVWGVFHAYMHHMEGNDEIAFKVAGHDLKGLVSYFNCKLRGLYLPMMLLLDYRGRSCLHVNSSLYFHLSFVSCNTKTYPPPPIPYLFCLSLLSLLQGSACSASLSFPSTSTLSSTARVTKANQFSAKFHRRVSPHQIRRCPRARIATRFRRK